MKVSSIVSLDPVMDTTTSSWLYCFLSGYGGGTSTMKIFCNGQLAEKYFTAVGTLQKDSKLLLLLTCLNDWMIWWQSDIWESLKQAYDRVGGFRQRKVLFEPVNADISLMCSLECTTYSLGKPSGPHETARMPIRYLTTQDLPIFQGGTPLHLRHKCLCADACSTLEIQHPSHGEQELEIFHLDHLLEAARLSFEQFGHLLEQEDIVGVLERRYSQGSPFYQPKRREAVLTLVQDTPQISHPLNMQPSDTCLITNDGFNLSTKLI